ncbi:MAG: ribonuclease HI [Deltaproteobacteria bacterium]|nr:ribonuclease HI [Deltaproteobacteria bacterium]
MENDIIVEIYTDGACKGNPGPGGYGGILKYGNDKKELSGYVPNTTNNRMELTAIIESLRMLKRPCNIRIVTDSSYAVKGMTEWLPVWIRKKWKNSQNKPVLNRDLWEELINLCKPHKIEWKWIKGHDGHKDNERCDELARKAIRNNLKE